MSNYPQAVQRQIDRTKALQEELNKRPTVNPAEPGTDPDTNVDPGTVNEGRQEPQSQPSKQPAAHEDWQGRYRTLQGKYDAEVPRLHHENTALKGQIATLETRMAQVEQSAKQPREEKPADASLNPGDFSEYGEEFENMARLVEEQKRQIQGQNQKMVELQQGVASVAQGQVQTRKEKFWAQIAQNIPGWEQQNNDPAFLEWLGQADPVSGERRQDILVREQQALNAQRVVSIFKSWDHVLKQPDARDTARNRKIESQITPMNTGTIPEITSQAPASYTREDIREFYKQAARQSYPFTFHGLLVKDQPDSKRVEMDIANAVATGQVR